MGTKRWRRVRAALATAVVLGCAAGLGACGPQRGDAVTVLTAASGAFVADPAGVEHPALEGERLRAGERVRSTTGRPVLGTGGRRTTLAPASALVLTAPSEYALSFGALVLDRRRGPAVVLHAGQVQISELGRTAVRVERGFSVRVAVYGGGGAAVRVAARGRALPALSEVIIPGASLPAQPAPLALRDDLLDVVADPPLVADDVALRRRADGLDGPGGAVVATGLRAALPRVLPAALVAPNGSAALSERVLPVAIATSARGSRPAQAYDTVRSIRSAGGSWGVIAALVGAPLGAVEGAITALADAVPAPAGADPAGAAAAAAGATPGAPAGAANAGGGGGPLVLAGPRGAPGPPGSAPTASRSAAPATPGPSGAARPSAPPAPSPSLAPASPTPPPSPGASPNPIGQLLAPLTSLAPLPVPVPSPVP